MLEHSLILLFPIAMVYAGAMDVMTMTIPNRISMALVIAFVALALLDGMGWSAFFMHLATGLGVLAIAVLMFSRGWIGGGDAKLLSAAALWFGYPHLLQYIFLVTLVGGALALVVIAYRHVVPRIWIAGYSWAERLHDRKSGIPYGVALAGAALWLYPDSPLFRLTAS
ncbi:MAG: prepilin peptidase [Hyphomicrobiaceae bacterium]